MAEREAEGRIEALEIRLAHQDQAIEDLNAALTRQWDQIDAMGREMARLADRLREAEARAAAGAPPEAPPPHY